MPKFELKRESSADAEDRRMLEEIRDMSLREVGVRGPGSYERGHRHRHRHRNGSRDIREEETRQRRDPDRHVRQEALRASNASDTRSGRPTDRRQQARQLEHQSSLRSLLSDSGLDSAEMQAEILRQIQEEGLLDGVDLDNLDVSQEDELSERIAEAYRRRHSQGLRANISPATESREPGTTRIHIMERDGPRHRQPSAPSEQVTHSSHPPISRPYLFEAYPAGQRHRHRTSSEHTRQTSPATAAALASTEAQRQAARSATDLSDRPRMRTNVRDRPAENTRRTNDPERRPRANPSRGRTLEATRAPDMADTIQEVQIIPPRSVDSPVQAAPPSPALSAGTTRRVTATSSLPFSSNDGQAPYPLGDVIPHGTTSTPSALTVQPTLYPEPSVSCDRCGKASVQYDLHFHCPLCSNGNFNICLRCYRMGKGCHHWFGFGKAAMQRYDRQEHTTSDPLPHRLTGRCYLRPPPQSPQTPTSTSVLAVTTSDPLTRLQSGFFCCTCSSFANSCFWKCSQCNEGEWGFCNPCVNQSKACTHPLLPITYAETKPLHRTSAGHSFTALPKPSRVPNRVDEVIRGGIEDYTPLTFATSCDICTNPIPPSTTRFHCPVCNDGDYDICTFCYHKLMMSNRISPENGTTGWRKCLQGHRMLVIDFEDHPTGQRRLIVKDRVGGYSIKEAETVNTTDIPRETKLRATAQWAYWPSEGVQDELGFPRGAEIVEATDRNGDWWEGWYCGGGGLWPGPYARISR